MPVPSDDIDRALFHYLSCTANFYKIEKLALNVLSAFAIPIFLLCGLTNKLLVKNITECDAVFLQVNDANNTVYPFDDFFPNEIRLEYKNIINIQKTKFFDFKSVVFDYKAIHIWKRLHRRYPFSLHFQLLVLIHMFSLNQLIIQYKPKSIITYRVETDPTSTLNTSFCESKGIDYVCFMHGDYLMQSIQCFFRFSKYYIWEGYRPLFIESRCAEDQYIEIVPPFFNNSSIRTDDENVTYYFDGEDDDIEGVIAVLNKLIKSGYICYIRPHPRFSDISKIKNALINSAIKFQNPFDNDIHQSIINTKYAIGKHTTVLSQAYFCGCNIIIDDVTDRLLYDQLKERKYICILRPHQLLSEFVKQTE